MFAARISRRANTVNLKKIPTIFRKTIACSPIKESFEKRCIKYNQPRTMVKRLMCQIALSQHPLVAVLTIVSIESDTVKSNTPTCRQIKKLTHWQIGRIVLAASLPCTPNRQSTNMKWGTEKMIVMPARVYDANALAEKNRNYYYSSYAHKLAIVHTMRSKQHQNRRWDYQTAICN